jgi:hypothetical protein
MTSSVTVAVLQRRMPQPTLKLVASRNVVKPQSLNGTYSGLSSRTLPLAFAPSLLVAKVMWLEQYRPHLAAILADVVDRYVPDTARHAAGGTIEGKP